MYRCTSPPGPGVVARRLRPDIGRPWVVTLPRIAVGWQADYGWAASQLDVLPQGEGNGLSSLSRSVTIPAAGVGLARRRACLVPVGPAEELSPEGAWGDTRARWVHTSEPPASRYSL